MFTPYGPSHWVLIVLILAGSLVLAGWGHRHRDPAAVWSYTRRFAVVILVFQFPLLVYALLPARWSWYDSLPLHLCDLAWVVAAYALWTHRWWAYALTYYWGLTLAPQAMFTPALRSPDFPHPDFIEFWGQHVLVVWAAVYLTWGVGMRPSWRGYRVAVLVTVGWGLAMLAFNEWAETNYGFVSSKPENPSLLDLMGGWPWYLAVELIAGIAVWALVTWPWTRVADRESGRAAEISR